MEKKSIKQSVHEVAEIISHTQNYQPLTPEEQQVLKKFFSQSDTDFQKTVENRTFPCVFLFTKRFFVSLVEAAEGLEKTIKTPSEELKLI